ncbi:urease accessory protein UreE [Burkholderia sp. L27(2015)]|uniref:urease accessory protein UreE n=1 Tax=Burkholderia sp. L27(2015) TaxID=1641858 RepID=UPI00131CD449|nr:urease accessory protein UreE [Burkholderia sp. L27(2015)]
MRKIDKRIGSDIKLARALVARAATLTLPYEARCKSRLAAHLDDGEAVALLMPRGTVLAEGDVLVAEDGALIRVVAAPESLMRVTASSAAELMRAAYHLGNRHTPVELGDGYLQLEVDTVLRDMLQGIGMRVEVVDAPFHPEAGAYGGGHKHGHDETFAEDYALAQKVYAEHDHGHAKGHDHGHGHEHGHQHEHEHAKAHKHGHESEHKHDENCQHNHPHSHDATD